MMVSYLAGVQADLWGSRLAVDWVVQKAEQMVVWTVDWTAICEVDVLVDELEYGWVEQQVAKLDDVEVALSVASRVFSLVVQKGGAMVVLMAVSSEYQRSIAVIYKVHTDHWNK